VLLSSTILQPRIELIESNRMNQNKKQKNW
jgi:hypothetical protein